MMPYYLSIFAAVSIASCAMAAPYMTTTTAIPYDCSGAAMNGVLEIACWGYRMCIDGRLIDHFCTPDTVLERETMTCVPPETANTDCHEYMLCGNREDGMYADKTHHCQTYYRCLRGRTMGRLYCPANLVFNERFQTCDYPYNVEQPCGLKSHSHP